MISDAAADELYGLSPDGFIARRTVLAKEAKAAGDKQLAADIAALRKPSTAAWALNVAVRADPGVFDELFALGERLRAAQHQLDAEELRRLLRERHAVVAATLAKARAAAEAAGRALSDAVAGEVDAALRAALADPQFAASMQRGQLVGVDEQGGGADLDVGPVAERPAARTKATKASKAPARSTSPPPASAPKPAPRPTLNNALTKAKESLRAAQARATDVARRRSKLDLELSELNQRRRALEVDERRAARAVEQAQAAVDKAASA